MIIEYESVGHLLSGDISARIPGYELSWRGVPYLPGSSPGLESISAALAAGGPDAQLGAAALLQGNYVLSVTDVRTRRHVVFTDPGGMFEAFVAGPRIGTSFLQLVGNVNATFVDIDRAALVEFLDLGNIYQGRTLLADITRLMPATAYELRADLAPITHTVDVPSIDAPPPQSFTPERFFADLASSLTRLTVSVDLTGGSDTRLVAAMLAKSLDIECAVSGTAATSDVVIARRVAQVLGCPFYQLIHDGSDVDGVAQALFEASDGMSDMLAFHRLRQMLLARAERHVDVAVGGAGGELYKDFWWIQDFPRYRQVTPNLERLFDLRVRPIRFPQEMLGAKFIASASELRSRWLSAMSRLVMPTNTATYDRIYYEMKMRTVAGHGISMNSGYVPFLTPLLDHTLVRYGYALPRRERIFSRVHRELISAASLPVARVRSNDAGMTLSSRGADEVRDLPRYFADKLQRVTKKASERLMGRTVLQESLDDPRLVHTARASTAFDEAVRRLIRSGVLSSDALVGLPDRYLGRVMTLGMLTERLGG